MKLLAIFIVVWIVILGLSYSLTFTIKTAWNQAVLETVSEKEIVERIVTEFVTPEFDFQVFEVTAYTAGPESTGKSPGHLAYGITASGEPVIERITMACPKSMPFGTKIYFPLFENVFTCTDRGSAITEGKIDIYMESLEHAKMFGRQKLEGLVLP